MDQLDSVDVLDATNVPPLVCIIEEPQGGLGTDERVLVSMISICASTGDVMWDQFEGQLSNLRHIYNAQTIIR